MSRKEDYHSQNQKKIRKLSAYLIRTEYYEEIKKKKKLIS